MAEFNGVSLHSELANICVSDISHGILIEFVDDPSWSKSQNSKGLQ